MATPWHKFPGGGFGSTPQRLLAHGLGSDYILTPVTIILGIQTGLSGRGILTSEESSIKTGVGNFSNRRTEIKR